jgi:hypothetical protein
MQRSKTKIQNPVKAVFYPVWVVVMTFYYCLNIKGIKLFCLSYELAGLLYELFDTPDSGSCFQKIRCVKKELRFLPGSGGR